MMMLSMFNGILRSTAFTVLSTGLLAVSIPIEPVDARNMYDVCLGQLQGVGVEPQQAATACADALIPKELSKCVSRVALTVSVPANVAVENCYQSRRPVDVANCVVDINNQVPLNRNWQELNRVSEAFAEPTPETGTTTTSESEPTPPVLALESCRRSLQPGIYSQCVTGLSRDVSLRGLKNALNTCLSAEDYPASIFPNYPQ